MKSSDNSHAAYADDGAKLPVFKANKPMDYDEPESPTAQTAHAHSAMHQAAHDRRHEEDYEQMTGKKLFPTPTP